MAQEQEHVSFSARESIFLNVRVWLFASVCILMIKLQFPLFTIRNYDKVTWTSQQLCHGMGAWRFPKTGRIKLWELSSTNEYSQVCEKSTRVTDTRWKDGFCYSTVTVLIVTTILHPSSSPYRRFPQAFKANITCIYLLLSSVHSFFSFISISMMSSLRGLYYFRANVSVKCKDCTHIAHEQNSLNPVRVSRPEHMEKQTQV